MAHTRQEFQTLRQNYLKATDDLRKFYKSLIVAMNNSEDAIRIVGDMAPMESDLSEMSDQDVAEISSLAQRLKSSVTGNGRAA